MKKLTFVLTTLLSIPLHAAFYVSPPRMDFESVVVGQKKRLAVNVISQNDDAAEAHFSTSCARDSFSFPMRCNTVMAPNELCRFYVDFNPIDTRAHRCQVFILDPRTGQQAQLIIYGRGVSPTEPAE